MADASGSDAVFKLRIVDRVREVRVADLDQSLGKKRQCVRRRQSIVFVQSVARFRDNASCEIDTAFGFALQKSKAARRCMAFDADDILTAHRHISVVLPTQPLDWHSIRRLFGNILGGEDLAQIAGTNGFTNRQLLANKGSGSILA